MYLLYLTEVIYVKSVLYDFNTVSLDKSSKYIFQYVSNRKLTDICHSHNFFEVCILLHGSVTEYCNDKERFLQEGTVTVLKPGDIHYFLSQSENVKLVCLSVEKAEALRLLADFDAILPENEIVFRVENIRSKVGSSITGAMREHHCKLLFCLIISLFLDQQKQAVPHSLQNAVQQMQQYENMQLGIPRLVALSGYSRSHLTRLVRQYYGVSLQALLMDLRLDTAYRDCILSKDPLEDIACNVGYSSFSHFNKIFKAKFGITPASLRKTGGMWTV